MVGQQWSWTFNYPDSVDGQNVYESGTGNYMPTLVLPVGETTRFELRTPDVIHDFGVPGFLMKMDVMPGQENHYQVTPKTEGTYSGKCYELCGVYHSRMLFNVEIVSARGVRRLPAGTGRQRQRLRRPGPGRQVLRRLRSERTSKRTKWMEA